MQRKGERNEIKNSVAMVAFMDCLQHGVLIHSSSDGNTRPQVGTHRLLWWALTDTK